MVLSWRPSARSRETTGIKVFGRKKKKSRLEGAFYAPFCWFYPPSQKVGEELSEGLVSFASADSAPL